LSLENEIKPVATHRFGILALVGKPNVGKSTLLNRIIGQKVSIVSNKAQTTRRKVLGILSEPDFQLVLIDTPGVHKPHTTLGKILNEAAEQSLSDDADGVLVVVDCHKAPDDEDKAIAQMLRDQGWIDEKTRKAKPNVILCMNKMDWLKAHNVVDSVQEFTKLFGTERYMMTSFRKEQNVDKLLELMIELLPEGPSMFPEDEFTNQTMRFMCAELVREQALIRTREEVPHAIATVVEDWEEEDNLTRMRVIIVCEKPGQKAILIGKGGAMLKEIGTEARLQMAEMLDKPVFLELFVKVRDEWRQNPRMLKELEYLD